jgi:hypothetical protein
MWFPGEERLVRGAPCSRSALFEEETVPGHLWRKPGGLILQGHIRGSSFPLGRSFLMRREAGWRQYESESNPNPPR